MKRLTTMTMQLSVDTSWWTRYRGTTNPDLGATFDQLNMAAEADKARRER